MSQIKQGTEAVFTLMPEKGEVFTVSDKVDALIHNGKQHIYYFWDHENNNPNNENIIQNVQTGFLSFKLRPDQTKNMLGRYTLEIRINDQIEDSTEITVTANKISSYPK